MPTIVMSSDTERVLDERLFQAATLADLVSMRDFVRRAAAAAGLAGPALEELVVAVNEAASNIIRHGFEGQPADITVVVAHKVDAVTVTLRDQGPAFDPADAPRPDTSLPLAKRPFGGMGVALIRELCDGLDYRRDAGDVNALRLLKKLGPADQKGQIQE